MSNLTVGAGLEYSSIEAAVAASQSGDTIDVQAGTYTNDFTTIGHGLTLQAIGGMVTMVATTTPPDGKAILDEGGAGVIVTIDGFAFTGAAVSDGNGAGIRYEGGTLNLSDADFYGNQDGILGAPDPNGVISITSSEFYDSGTGDGETHNIYIGDIQSFSLTNSFVHDESVGNEVKSRAATNTITNDRIFDNTSTASYEIDLPNGGNASISGNVIEQGPNSENSNIIAYGEEGSLLPGTSLSITGNTILNDLGRGPALFNTSSVTIATFANNSVYGFGNGALVSGAANESGTIVLAAEPALDQSAPYSVAMVAPVQATPTQPVTPESGLDGLVVDVAEDAYQGDAQFIVTEDGQQVGGTYTATTLQGSGATQPISLGSLLLGPHQIGITFINDDYAGTPSTDRNLYLDGASYNGQAIAGAAATLLSTGSTALFVADGDAPPASGLIIDVAEDAYQGDAQFTVEVDGAQVGGVHTTTASNALGQSQAFGINAMLSTGSHDIGVTFINDAYAGTPATGRNLYITGATLNGQDVSGAAASLFSSGTHDFTIVVPVT